MIYRVTELLLRITLSLVVPQLKCLSWIFWAMCDLCYFVLLGVREWHPMWHFFPRLCLCSVQVFFFVCETPPLLFVLSCLWLYRRLWDFSSWFRAALHKGRKGRARLVLIFLWSPFWDCITMLFCSHSNCSQGFSNILIFALSTR